MSNSSFKVGEVRVATDEDFKYFLSLCQEHNDWSLDYDKRSIQVWTKSSPHTNIRMLKVGGRLETVSAEQMYDCLHDAEYRKQWDKHMLSSFDICRVGLNSDINYYAFYSPPPLQNRDFVTQRVWLQTDKFGAIFNHSVFHKKAPPKRNYIRALSYLTGYLAIPVTSTSCIFYYVSQCDPGGSVPTWAVNNLTQMLAPSNMKRLAKVAMEYPAWKASHQPNYKPWLNPELLQLENINYSDVSETPDFDMKIQQIDESQEKEAAYDASRLDGQKAPS